MVRGGWLRAVVIVQVLEALPLGSQWCVVGGVEQGCSHAGTGGWSVACAGLKRVDAQHVVRLCMDCVGGSVRCTGCVPVCIVTAQLMLVAVLGGPVYGAGSAPHCWVWWFASCAWHVSSRACCTCRCKSRLEWQCGQA